MRTLGTVFLLAGLALAVLAAPAAPARAEEQQVAPPQSEHLIQNIRRENENVISGRHFTYDPAGRRDPFEPLIKTENKRGDGKRPIGIAGMLVNEIDLKGVATDVRGDPVAMFRGSDNRGYTLHVGDIVYDGRVIAIDTRRGLVVFRQQVDDPRRIKPFRDVIKRLQVNGGEDSGASAEEEGA